MPEDEESSVKTKKKKPQIFKYNEGSLVLKENPSSSISSPRTEAKLPINTCECADILLVDDDTFNLFSLAMILKKLGFKTTNAHNGQQAVERLIDLNKKNPCCCNCQRLKLVFMDLNMPVMDGLEATRRIKRKINDGELADITIIACTANDSRDDMKNSLLAGMSAFLTKPITLEKVSSILSKLTVNV